MDFLIRFAQTHESFRLAEIETLTTQLISQYARQGIEFDVEMIDYQATSPFCTVRFHILRPLHVQHGQSGSRVNTEVAPTTSKHDDDLVDTIAKDFITRSIQARAIYALWGHASSYADLHLAVRRRSQHLWHKYQHSTSFKFSVDSFMGKRNETEKRTIINSFAYLGFEGKVDMRRPDEEWCIMEEWVPAATHAGNGVASSQGGEQQEEMVQQMELEGKPAHLKRVFLGRKVGTSRRHLIEKHDLKKRPYISTTSMDAELALITANLALASPGKIFLDPFCGTGGFMMAAAELGAFVLGHDIDGRSFRGKGTGLEKGVGANIRKYGLGGLVGDCFTADLINTSLCLRTRWLDGIICDPPYGVREGLKVLGSRKSGSPMNGEVSAAARQPHLIDGIPAHTLPGFIAPKKPYSFVRMLDDILDFAVEALVDGGRLAFWMPSANENEFGEEEFTVIPSHPMMELKHECVQRFNKWSRRLLVYDRRRGDLSQKHIEGLTNGIQDLTASGTRADDLNPFRRRYFEAFVEKPNG